MTALATTPLARDRSAKLVPAPRDPETDARRQAMKLLKGEAMLERPVTTSRCFDGRFLGVNNLPGAGDAFLDRDATATALMDFFRRTRSREAFDTLVDLTKDQLLARVQSRTRYLSQGVDPHELLQDAYINIYCYPDRFDASRPGAFRAWSTTIVDNAVRRHLRKAKSGPDVRLKPVEILSQEADESDRGPCSQAVLGEQYREAGRTFQLFLMLYMKAYQALSERERFVLQMVEVKGLRYAELSTVVGIRPEALKMVVFRARKRIAKRIQQTLANAA